MEKTAEGAKVEKAKAPKIPPKETVLVGGQKVPVNEVDTEKKKAIKRVTKAGSIFTALNTPGPDTKMPLQCKQIMGLLNEAPNKTMNREALLKAMEPVVKTRQPIERILGFYQSRLIAGNWVKVTDLPKAEVKKPEVKEVEAVGTKAPA